MGRKRKAHDVETPAILAKRAEAKIEAPDGLTIRQLQAIAVILSGESIVRSAAICGVAEATLRNWLRDDEAFRRELALQRGESYQSWIGRAFKVMEESMNESDWKRRHAAALALLKYDSLLKMRQGESKGEGLKKLREFTTNIDQSEEVMDAVIVENTSEQVSAERDNTELSAPAIVECAEE